ncbi:hypothetical protein Goklo_026098, partial [Gossypium klotzschianum]|nr:hypothetical protein [Gossypium klotzschianum]
KKLGAIASLVSPCPVTPAVLSTPIFSPSKEVLGDMAKEEWGVDGYGLMKELIQLRPPKTEEGKDSYEKLQLPLDKRLRCGFTKIGQKHDYNHGNEDSYR